MLTHHPHPVGLRYVARLANIHPHSAELALAGLVRDNLVTRSCPASRPQYALNREHAAFPLLKAVFRSAAEVTIGERGQTLADRAKTILPFIEKSRRMFARAKGAGSVA